MPEWSNGPVSKFFLKEIRRLSLGVLTKTPGGLVPTQVRTLLPANNLEYKISN